MGELYDEICETQFKKHLTSTSSDDFVKHFDKYMEFLRHENSKLSKVWLSYLDMVEVLLRLLIGNASPGHPSDCPAH